MAKRRQQEFQTIKSEGALLPADFLKRVVEGDKEIEGLKPEDYHYDPSERLGDAISRAWTACRDAWQRFQKRKEELPESDRGTTLTRESWLLVLFRELGYGVLHARRAPFEIDDKPYSISHEWQRAPIHLISFRFDLDKSAKGIFRTSPHSLVQELLNRSDDHLWAILSNGSQLRILRDNVSFTRSAYVEFDLEGMMEGEIYSDFVLLWLLCHPSRVEGDIPEKCWLEKWHQTARQQGTRALDRLRDGVERAIQTFGQGFLAHRSNGLLRQKLGSGELTTQQYYQQLLRLVYRLIFLFVAEDRDLLLLRHIDDDCRERYVRHYSMSRIRRLAERRRGTRHGDLWQAIKLVLTHLYKGQPNLGLPALGSMLFSEKAMPELECCGMANDQVLEAIRQLAFTIDRNVLRQVDYKNLGSEELGSVYESLLELHPDINADSATFELTTVAGSERKSTGSYYTPSSLINCLLDSALDPVVADALKRARSSSYKENRQDAEEEALLNLKVCDPACGSGHFLIAAANRIAHHLASVRTGDEEPSPAALRTAFRDVVSHCIYGVDLNPMAVELCKVALWLESLDPGKPLNFLDHRILCGNSLIGVTPGLIEEGIPDAALKPIAGDDKEYCRELKRQNKQERTDYADRQQTLFQPWEQLGNLASAMMNIDHLPDDSLADVENKRKQYESAVQSSGYLYGRLLADAWCAAFVWKKIRERDGGQPYPITEQVFRSVQQNPHSVPPWLVEEVQRLSGQYQFLHRHLAFPDVFHLGLSRRKAISESAKTGIGENDQMSWDAGFDVVLGNPPWEHIELKEREWFSQRASEIAAAKTGAARKNLITTLKAEKPDLFRQYLDAKRDFDASSAFLGNSNHYPFCGRGRINSYAVFAELMRGLTAVGGRIGTIVPSGIATDDTTKLFFQDLINSHDLVSLFDFENKLLLFESVAPVVKFALVTMANTPNRDSDVLSQFAFFCHTTSDIDDANKRFALTRDDIALLNPNTRTCPIFRSARDAELAKAIHRRIPVLCRKDDLEQGNPWGATFRQGLFNMTSDSGLFRTREQLDNDGFSLNANIFAKENAPPYLPVYEAKLIQQFNHRPSTFDGIPESSRFKMRAGTNSPTASQLDDADFFIIPRFWVGAHEVDRAASELPDNNWFLCFRGMTNVMTNSRNVIFSAIPRVGVGNSAPILSTDHRHKAFALLAAANSFVFDYAARQKIGGGNLNFFIVEQLPMAPPDMIPTIIDISGRVLELTYTAWDVKAFAMDCGYDGPPFRWNDERRFMLRCELDAAYFFLYLGDDHEWVTGDSPLAEIFPTPRHAVDYIMETFPIVKRKDIKGYGEFRTKRVILEVYDEMADAMKTGKPYQSRLNPPPGPPADEQGNFLPLPDWKPGERKPADWPSHIHPPRHVMEKEPVT